MCRDTEETSQEDGSHHYTYTGSYCEYSKRSTVSFTITVACSHFDTCSYEQLADAAAGWFASKARANVRKGSGQ
jgi:hypothetical protein